MNPCDAGGRWEVARPTCPIITITSIISAEAGITDSRTGTVGSERPKWVSTGGDDRAGGIR